MQKKQSAGSPASGARRRFVSVAGIGGALAVAAGSARAAMGADAPKSDTCVSLVPYFEINAGKVLEFKALGPKFVELTRQEPGCLYYGFSFSGQTAHCREGYVNADALLKHLANVDAVLKQALTLSSISRLEVHGPADEIEKLRTPLAGLKPQFFTLAAGGFRR